MGICMAYKPTLSTATHASQTTHAWSSACGRHLSTSSSRDNGGTDKAERTIKPSEPLTTDPSTAVLWRQVRAILTPPIWTYDDDMHVLDLRKPPWEFLQTVKMLPVVGSQHGITRMAVTTSTPHATIQRRLNEKAPWYQIWMLTTMGDTWWVTQVGIPERIASVVEEAYAADYWDGYDDSPEQHDEDRALQRPPGNAEGGIQEAPWRQIENERQRTAAIQQILDEENAEQEVEIERGGGKRNRRDADGGLETIPKQAMAVWALQRAHETVPEAVPQTISTLLRAEPKLASAIIYSKSAQQVRHSLAAAYRRAGLSPPQELSASMQTQQQQDQGTSSATMASPATQVQDSGAMVYMNSLIQAMYVQTNLLSGINASVSELPTQEVVANLSQAFTAQQDASVQAMRQFSGVLDRLQQRMENWETNILPEILERLPVATSPTDNEDSQREGEELAPAQPAAEMTHEEAPAATVEPTVESSAQAQPEGTEQETQTGQHGGHNT